MTFANFGDLAVNGETTTPAKKRAAAECSTDSRKKSRMEMTLNVAKINLQMINCNKSEYNRQLNDLKEKRFQLKREMRQYKRDALNIADYEEEWEAGDSDWCKYNERLEEIDSAIKNTNKLITECNDQLANSED